MSTNVTEGVERLMDDIVLHSVFKTRIQVNLIEKKKCRPQTWTAGTEQFKSTIFFQFSYV